MLSKIYSRLLLTKMQTSEILIGRWMKGIIPPADWVMEQVNMHGKNITIREEDGYNHWYAHPAVLTYFPPKS